MIRRVNPYSKLFENYKEQLDKQSDLECFPLNKHRIETINANMRTEIDKKKHSIFC